MRYPLIVPGTVPLSEHLRLLAEIEKSGRYSNFGPVNTALEAAFLRDLFDGAGHVTTVVNATIGLMLALKASVRHARLPERRVRVILPSFTFAATGHAVAWCGYPMTYADVDSATWSITPEIADAMIRTEKKRGRAPVLLSYPAFGAPIALKELESVCRHHDVPMVCDAASSLGSRLDGRQVGAGLRSAVVYSMHATKTMAGLEGGLVYSTDAELVRAVRQMSNYGFDSNKTAQLQGLNGKMHEVSALACLLKLRSLAQDVHRKQKAIAGYQQRLLGVTYQDLSGGVPAYGFFPVCLSFPHEKARLIAACRSAGLELGDYFGQPLHRNGVLARPARLPVTDDLADRVVNLPLHAGLSDEDIDSIARIFNRMEMRFATHRAAA